MTSRASVINHAFGTRPGCTERAAGGDFSYTSVLRERQTVLASWPQEPTSRIHLYYGSDRPCKLPPGGDFSYTFVFREPQSLQAGRGRRLLVYIRITGATVPATWPREATSRIHLYYGSDSPCKLAAKGDYSYTFVLWERQSLQAGRGRRLLVYICIRGATLPASWIALGAGRPGSSRNDRALPLITYS